MIFHLVVHWNTCRATVNGLRKVSIHYPHSGCTRQTDLDQNNKSNIDCPLMQKKKASAKMSPMPA